MTPKEIEVELQKIDPAFSVVKHRRLQGLNTVLHNGRDIGAAHFHFADETPKTPDHNVRYTFPEGREMKIPSFTEILDSAQAIAEAHKAGDDFGFDT